MPIETIRKPVTLKMIARQLGISLSTVSVVLNGMARQRQINLGTLMDVVAGHRQAGQSVQFAATLTLTVRESSIDWKKALAAPSVVGS